MSAEKFVQTARGFLGVRWRHRGRKPWALDCVGLIVLSLHAAGRSDIEDVTGYGREPWDDELRRQLRKHFGEPAPQPQVGDIALIRWRDGEPSHVGIIGDHPHGLSLIHANNIHGVVEHSLTGQYLQSVVEVYRPWPAKSSQ